MTQSEGVGKERLKKEEGRKPIATVKPSSVSDCSQRATVLINFPSSEVSESECVQRSEHQLVRFLELFLR